MLKINENRIKNTINKQNETMKFLRNEKNELTTQLSLAMSKKNLAEADINCDAIKVTQRLFLKFISKKHRLGSDHLKGCRRVSNSKRIKYDAQELFNILKANTR